MKFQISWRDYACYPAADTVTIMCVTDIPCHCRIRVSKTPPDVHKVEAMKRGLSMTEEYYFCFVGYQDFDESQAGDRLIHFFVIPEWPYCKTKWFYFYGSQAGWYSISTSAWFKYHNALAAPPPVMVQKVAEPWTLEGGEAPDMHIRFYEMWNEESPEFTIRILETWDTV